MKTFRNLCIAALMATASVAQAQSGADHSGHGGGHSDQSAASRAYMDAMTRMDDDMRGMTMSGKPGVDFAEMMIPHHQAAIDMARAYLDSGENDAELERLSREIIEAQEAEIAVLKAWLEKNRH